MPDTTLQLPAPAPLTIFSADEVLFRDNIRQFADDKLRPLVKEMDEKGVFDHDLIQAFVAFLQKSLGCVNPEVIHELGRRGLEFVYKHSGKIARAHCNLGRELLHIQIVSQIFENPDGQLAQGEP